MSKRETSTRKDVPQFVYQMTPATPFSPTAARQGKKNVVYKIGSVMHQSESRTMEYKTGGGRYPLTVLREHVQKYGSAFLNSGGGTLCVGVTDDGTIVGVRLSFSELHQVSRLVKSEFENFTPSVGIDMYEVDFITCNKTDHYVIEIHVRAGNPAEIYEDGLHKMWIKRDGSVQGPVWPRDIKEIVTSKYLKSLKESASSSAEGSEDPTPPIPALILEQQCRSSQRLNC